MAKILIILSIILAAIVVAGMHPPLSAASIACIILFMAGAVVLYHEMGALSHAKPAGPARRGSSETHAQNAVSGPWVWSGADRRAASIELRPSDSVEQIARKMISVSFRQAWQKYHSEHGGAHDLPGRIVQAQNLLLTAFRKD